MLKRIKIAVVEIIAANSIRLALWQAGLSKLFLVLYKIQPDLSRQYSFVSGFNRYWELKLRAQHAFQCSLMQRGIDGLTQEKVTVVDIGDSAGTHMRYLKSLAAGRHNLETISVNLDPVAIEKIKAQGLTAILCRAEDLILESGKADMCVSFEMLEHLHNPAVFLYRLAKQQVCNRLVITVPYLKRSRVGLGNVRNGILQPVTAEGEHIFELNPRDWSLLMRHSGWKAVYTRIYYQYPRFIPFISMVLAWFWRKTDFEGFWGVILVRDTTFSQQYRDWEE